MRPRLLVLLLAFALGCGAASTARPAAPAAPARLAWETWRPEAFARARRENRLLLVDVAAGWCHWCHVMDEQTYADPEVARLLADGFVAIRVDADARPDLAERYQRWGWPATAILTPDAQPVLERKGFQAPRPFAALLARLVADHAAGRPLARDQESALPPAGPADLARILASSRAQLDGFYDEEQEGWGGPQKYPYAAPIEHAFTRALLRDEPMWRARALATLERETALLDPVWGGMFQYSVGGTWGEPHYEKIVAIQAGAIENAAMAYQVTGDERWLAVARSVRGYLNAFLRTSEGTYGASQDADVSERMLGRDFYSLDDAGRRRVGAPRVDTNVYADGNGLVIRALCALYASTGEAGVLADARAAMDRLARTHRRGAGRWVHAAGQDGAIVYLADEVAMGRAALALYEAAGEARDLDEAKAVAALLLAGLRADGHGGLLGQTPDPHAVGVFAERRTPFEGNASGARFLLALSAVTRDDRFRAAAIEALEAVSRDAEIRARGRTVGEHVLALEEVFLHRVHVTVVGRADEPGAQALHRAALRLADPRAVVAWGAPGAEYPDIGRPAAYLCDDRSCSSPISDPARFAEQAVQFLATL